jgi:GT2 family glycosyltransferase
MKQTISFIILSYNRPQETIEAIDNVINFLYTPKGYFKEIVIVNNNSQVDYRICEQFIADNLESDTHKIVYIKNSENSGVAGGRNIAMKKSTGEIIVSLDDDAEFRERNLIEYTEQLFDKHKKDKVAIIGFNIVNLDGSVVVSSKRKDKFTEKEFFTSYFAGGAHALQRSLLNKIGYYEKGELYGAEEYDLSYRALDNGYQILHCSNLSILHKKSMNGRLDIADETGMLLKNKSLLAYKYLSKKYYYSHLFFWSLFFLKNCGLKIRKLSHFIKITHHEAKQVVRTPIKKSTVNYILSIGGRLKY